MYFNIKFHNSPYTNKPISRPMPPLHDPRHHYCTTIHDPCTHNLPLNQQLAPILIPPTDLYHYHAAVTHQSQHHNPRDLQKDLYRSLCKTTHIGGEVRERERERE